MIKYLIYLIKVLEERDNVQEDERGERKRWRTSDLSCSFEGCAGYVQENEDNEEKNRRTNGF